MSEMDADKIPDALLENLLGGLGRKGTGSMDAWKAIRKATSQRQSLIDFVFSGESPSGERLIEKMAEAFQTRPGPNFAASPLSFVSPLSILEVRPDPPEWQIPAILQAASRAKTELTMSEYLMAQSFGLNLDETPLHRVLPVDVYLQESSAEAIASVEIALLNLLTASGFEVIQVYPAETGSHRRRLVVRTSDRLSRSDLDRRLANIEAVLAEAGKSDSEPEDLIRTWVELAKGEAERKKANAEAVKAWAEGAKAIAEASVAFVKVLRGLTFSAILLIGTISVSSHPRDSGPSVIEIARKAAVEAFTQWVQPPKASAAEHPSTEASKEAGAE